MKRDSAGVRPSLSEGGERSGEGAALNVGAAGDGASHAASRRGWTVVGAASVAMAVIFGAAYSFAALFSVFAAEFSADRADVALVFGLSGLLYFGLGAGAGILADRFGPRVVCTAGMLCIAAGLVASSRASSLGTLYAAWGIGLGVGIGLVYAPAIASVAPWFVRHRGLASGIASTGIGVGTLFVPLGVAAAISSVGWRNALLALAIFVAVFGLAATSQLRRAPAARSAGPTLAEGMTLGEALRSARFWWMYAAAVAVGPAMFIPFAHVSAAARDLGIDEARAVGLVGLIGVGSLVGRFAIGALADRFGRIGSIAVLEASLGASYLLWLAAGGYLPLAVFALWFGLSYGGIVSLMPAICMDLFGGRALSSILGTLYTGAAFGNLLGPVVGGAIYDRTGSYTPVLIGCIVLSAIAATASMQLLRTGRTTQGTPQESAPPSRREGLGREQS